MTATATHAYIVVGELHDERPYHSARFDGEIDPSGAGTLEIAFDGDDIDLDESAGEINGRWYDLDALLLEAGYARMPDGSGTEDGREMWREDEPGCWMVEVIPV